MYELPLLEGGGGVQRRRPGVPKVAPYLHRLRGEADMPWRLWASVAKNKLHRGRMEKSSETKVAAREVSAVHEAKRGDKAL